MLSRPAEMGCMAGWRPLLGLMPRWHMEPHGADGSETLPVLVQVGSPEPCHLTGSHQARPLSLLPAGAGRSIAYPSRCTWLTSGPADHAPLQPFLGPLGS